MLYIQYDHVRDYLEPESKIIVMYSGGVDSIGNLYYLLDETNLKVHVHNITLHTREKRTEAEKRATNLTLEWFANNMRPIDKFTESEIDITVNSNFAYDVDIVAFVVTQIMIAEGDLKYFASGINYDDSLRHMKLARGDNFTRIIDGALNGTGIHSRFTRILHRKTKEEIINDLPQELVDVSWSCRTPVNKDNVFHRCGKCVSCIEAKKRNIWDRTPHTI